MIAVVAAALILHGSSYTPVPRPVASAVACGMTPQAWRAYKAQLRIAVADGDPGANIADAHCWPFGATGRGGTGGLLNTRAVNQDPGKYGWHQ